MRIIFTRPNTGIGDNDGGVSVHPIQPKSELEKVLGSMTEDEYKKHAWERVVPLDAITPTEIPDDYALPGREFRNAWKQNGKEITHDLEKARSIQLDRIRAARKPKMETLDLEFMLAIEKGTSIEKISLAKQILRDITEPLKKMVLNSIDDVKGAFPEMLR